MALGDSPIDIVDPFVEITNPLIAESDEVAGTEKLTVCAPDPMVNAPPAADKTTVPLVKVVLEAAMATPPPPAPPSILIIEPLDAARVMLFPAESMIVDPEAVDALEVLPCRLNQLFSAAAPGGATDIDSCRPFEF